MSTDEIHDRTAPRAGEIQDGPSGAGEIRAGVFGSGEVRDSVSGLSIVQDGVSGLGVARDGVSGAGEIPDSVSRLGPIRDGLSGADEIRDGLSGAGPGEVRVSADWLALREPADAAARAVDLVDEVRRALRPGRVVVHDLGCGTGSMARWLGPRLPGPQHWVLYDRDPDLLTHAAAAAPMSTETRRRDITHLHPGDLDGASLITASALLDMFTADELARFVQACAAVGCPVLLTTSVIGRVDFDPANPLDATLADAFNDHQRRILDGRRLLGPDAVGLAAEAFAHLGREVLVRPSPWRLGPAQMALIAEWFVGWLDAAVEQRPDLGDPVVEYARWRLSQAAAGRLRVTVHHRDLLVRPR